ncbi:MAG: DNA polymerase IV [Planctomycetota bacterium]
MSGPKREHDPASAAPDPPRTRADPAGARAGPARTILHADMDAFYAAIEQRDRPELRGRPVIVGGAGPRSVVATASYEARKFGVRSAMPGVRAKRLCPRGIFVAPRMDVYVRESERILRIFGRYTDLIEPLSLDEAFLDVTGSRALFGDGRAIASRIKREVFEQEGLTVSVGVAASKFVAKIASDLRKPDGLVVVEPGAERAFLAPLPIGRLWGAGPRTQEALERAGIRTIGDLQSRSLEDLIGAFGERQGGRFFALANGIDPRNVEPSREARAIGHETTFGEDLRTRGECHAQLLRLSERVARRLRREGAHCACVRLKVRHGDFTTFTRQRRVEPTQDERVIYSAARKLFGDLWPEEPGIRLLGVAAASLVHRPPERDLFDADRGRSSRLLSALDRIVERFGEDAIHHGLDPRRRKGPGGTGARGAPSSAD